MPRFLDLFAGAGGLSKGFIQAGYSPVAHVEMDVAACYTLKTRAAFHWLKANENTQHYRYCLDCYSMDSYEYGDHTGGTATCIALAKCELCGIEYGSTSSHRDFTDWEYENPTEHYRFCVDCGGNPEAGEHDWSNGIFTYCGMVDAADGPVITKQPTDAEAKLGENFCVEVLAEGEGLKYQWYFRNAGTDVWHKSGVTDNTYDDVMTTARAGREVYCVITDASGNSVTTDTATLIAVPTAELAILAQPNDSSAKLGEIFCVTVEAQGDELRYQWYWRNVGSETWNVSGQRDNTYDDVMTGARHNREVYCVITDIWGNSVTTETVTLICTEEPQAIAMN